MRIQLTPVNSISIMNLYIIGICGTFMGGVARLARDMGFSVSGSDANTYPPMSTQLESLGVTLFDGYRADNIPEDTDMIIVGNAISRGNPELEYTLNKGFRYTSGAQWLGENVLQNRWVLAVAGTHGKTTTTSMLAWILDYNQLSPGYLIGGVPENFGESARLGETPFFVIEADEYDTAFSDKRSKFVHYRPRTLILNNLEFDHADIFDNLQSIQTQFHHLLRITPSDGQVIYNQQSTELDTVLKMGCWSETVSVASSPVGSAKWQAKKLRDDASEFEISTQATSSIVTWSLIGDHNMSNAVSAVAAAHHVGIPTEMACEALSSFKSVKRRMEKIFDNGHVKVFDDFAHHPTAIDETLKGLRHSVGKDHIIAVLEPRSNTMKQGVHKHLLKDSLSNADLVLLFTDENVQWDTTALVDEKTHCFDSTNVLLQTLLNEINKTSTPTHVLIMSNGGFENLHRRLINKLN